MKELFLLLMRILVAVGTIMLTEPSTQNNSVKFVDLPYHWEDREIALNTAGVSFFLNIRVYTLYRLLHRLQHFLRIIIML